MRRFVLGLVVVVVSTALVSSPSRAGDGDRAASATTPDRIDRLVGLAHVWATVKYFHPAMFQRAIDWDAALVKTIPKVEAATDAESYRAAIESLLTTIGDPHTAVTLPAVASKPAADWKSWATKDVLVLNARLPRDPADGAATRRLAHDAEADLAKAKVVVIDLRGISNEEDAWDSLLDRILDDLPSTSTWPTIRRIRHVGFRSQGETNRDTYTTSWDVASAGAPTRGAAAGPSHVVFVVDPHETLPLAAVALWMSRHATLVSSGELDENVAATSTRVELPYGLVANVRTSEVLLPSGRAIAADVVTSGTEDVRARAIAIATAIAAGGAPPRGSDRRASTTDTLRVVDDDDDPTTGLPSRERRALAAMRVWAVIEYFHGVHRLDHDWEKQLRATIPLVEAATDADAYKDALNEMLVPLYDGHTVVYSPTAVAARASTVIYWRCIGKKIVAGGLRDEAQAKQAGIALGDELLEIDGVAVADRIAKILPTISNGTEEARQQWAVTLVDRGARGTVADVKIRGADGKVRKVSLTREFDYSNNFWAHDGPHYQVFPGNIGFADLTRLTTDELDPMWEALGKTKAIIFDMRGYPNGTAWLIGARINTKDTHALAEFRTPIVTADTIGYDVTQRSIQRGLTTDKPIYRGKIVVLIDDRAISSAEHTCLILEATGGAKFVGTPTSGTNGEETYDRLPGGLEVRFTGQEVLHADGRQLQQVGIQPDITVRPTVTGLRAGKDEVLDRARFYLRSGR